MDNREWLNEFPSLRQVKEGNPFAVPENYFDDLQQRTMSAIFLEGLNKEAGFTVPENYFEEQQSNLQSRINIDEALHKAIGSFAVPENYFEDMQGQVNARIAIEEAMSGKTEGFTVPDEYFESMQAQITARIAIDEVVEGKTEGFAVPADYFERMRAQINARIAVDEVLENAEGEGFAVPDQYFSKLQDAILAKTTGVAEENAEAPVVQLNARLTQATAQRRGIVRKLVNSGVFKYATAACIVVALGTTWFVNRYESPKEVHKRSYIHQALSGVSDDDIIDYLQMHMDAADTRGVMDEADQINTDNASADELKEYLSTH